MIYNRFKIKNNIYILKLSYKDIPKKLVAGFMLLIAFTQSVSAQNATNATAWLSDLFTEITTWNWLIALLVVVVLALIVMRYVGVWGGKKN